MENYPQWEAPCPPDLILYKEQDEEYVAEQDEQEYDAGYLGISQLVMQWRLRWHFHDNIFIAIHLGNKCSPMGSRVQCSGEPRRLAGSGRWQW